MSTSDPTRPLESHGGPPTEDPGSCDTPQSRSTDSVLEGPSREVKYLGNGDDNKPYESFASTASHSTSLTASSPSPCPPTSPSTSPPTPTIQETPSCNHKSTLVCEHCSAKDEQSVLQDLSRRLGESDESSVKLEEPLAEKEVDWKQLDPLPSSLTTLDRRIIGSGSHGMVYRAIYNKQPVAVKTISDLRYQPQLRRECRVMLLSSQFSHQNVVSYLGSNVTTDKDLCIIMEWSSKGSLAKLLKDHTLPLPWERRLSLALDIAKGIEHLHTKCTIIHRDLKSSNVLIREDNTPFLIDFGLSKVLTQSLSTGTKMIGTVAWMAPEMFNEEAKTTKAVDIYGFGMILFELLTRGQPFKNWTALRIMVDVQSGIRPVIPPSSLSECPRGYVDLMRECWHKIPEKRPNISNVIMSLERMIQKEEPTESSTFELNELNPREFKDSDLLRSGRSNDYFRAKYRGDIVIVKRAREDNKELVREGELLASLRHPNIIRMRGYQATDHPFLVTEFGAKGPLNALIFDKDKELPWIRRLVISLHILEGLIYLHSNNVIHRDLKLSNCLVRDDWSIGLRNIKRPLKLIHRKYFYSLSPEMLDRTDIVTYFDDIYAFGIILFELLTRQSAFKGYLDPQVLHKIRSGGKPTDQVWKIDTETEIFSQTIYINLMKNCWRKPTERPTLEIIKSKLDCFLQMCIFAESLDGLNPSPDELSFSHAKVEGNSRYPTFATTYERPTRYDVMRSIQLRMKLNSSTGDASYIQAETKKLKRLDHGNIRQCFGSHTYQKNAQRTTVLFLESAKDDLEQFLGSSDVSWCSRLNIALDVANALDYLHSQSVIHGQIRSQNVFIRENYTAFLGTFESMVLDSSAELPRNWLPPELLLAENKDQQPTAECDIYGLGLLLYFLLMKRQPYENDLVAKIMDLTKNPKNLLKECKLITDCPNGYRQLMLQCLNPKAKDRPKLSNIILRLNRMQWRMIPIWLEEISKQLDSFLSSAITSIILQYCHPPLFEKKSIEFKSNCQPSCLASDNKKIYFGGKSIYIYSVENKQLTKFEKPWKQFWERTPKDPKFIEFYQNRLYILDETHLTVINLKLEIVSSKEVLKKNYQCVGMKVDQDIIHLTCQSQCVIYRYQYQPQLKRLSSFGRKESEGKLGEFSQPTGITIHSDLIFVCDSKRACVQKGNKTTGEFLSIIPGFNEPTSIYYAHNLIFVHDKINLSILTLNGFQIQLIPNQQSQIVTSSSLCLYSFCLVDDELYIVDNKTNRIQIFRRLMNYAAS